MIPMTRRICFVFLLALFLATAPAAPPNLAKAKLDPERLARIPVRMKAFVDKGTVAGIVTLVARHGEVAQLEAVGWQDADARKPLRTDTIFQIMSMTKPVVGVAIMMLAEEGRLSLGDPVEKHLPDFRGQWMIESRDGDKARALKKPARPITVRDLMTHTSGMPGSAPVPNWQYRTLSESVSISSQQPLEFEPGTKWLYSNSGINTLGRIIEVLADKPFEQFVEERIFQPLGMKDSHFYPPAEKHERISMVYRLEEGKIKRAEVDLYRKGYKNPSPAGGMFSTAADMAAFYQMMLNGGSLNGKKLLSKSGVEVMTVNHTGTMTAGHGPGLGFGLTWNVVRESLGTLSLLSEGTFMHGGAFGTHGWVDPKKNMVGVFMIQRTGGGGAAERDAFLAMANAATTE